MSKIEGKAAVVTGGTRGIGLSIAEALLKRGARVYVCARKEAEVKEVVGRLKEAHGASIFGGACDVGRPGDVKSMIEEASRAMGRLDILINNAGVGSHNEVERMPVEEWKATIDTNLSGLFYCCHEAIPLIRRQGGGYIINIGSLAGKNAFAGGAAYCASKFGLIGFSEALMQELRYDHIRVSYVMPGSVNTGFGRGGGEDLAASWKLQPEDVAEAVVNLIEMDPRALASRVELRPSEPKK
ncbi:MAG TPA: SDR family oxidoreductase [Blastocatellia bacterium]|jgi:NAD(P)-dependent dehydrogenase (short-subunit alcohol dehydrogenase family)|nr:SDR family oxidoreductase [Blastocatellia bacterium]